ncbi:uncharacterized protein LOC128882537 isoform X3 [Hylaeus volcanicus]|uniref:uncharacterized protein LOC128882537 isoform X3 n=1 Tax=Hylaeus volcanicus TaxID=313075 RepID=UPI0023B7DB9E|nr:uncharacterized protein LOC128882537 isoform X3 [Hylaeus volcanicus]
MRTPKKKPISTFFSNPEQIQEARGRCHKRSNSFNSDASYSNTKPFEEMTEKNELYSKDAVKLFTSCFYDFAKHPLSEGTKRRNTVKKYQNFKSKCRQLSLVFYILFLLGVTAKETTKSQDLNFICFLLASFGSYIISILIGWFVIIVTLSRKHVIYSITLIFKRVFYRTILLHNCCYFTSSFVEDESKHFQNTTSRNKTKNKKKNFFLCCLNNSFGNFILKKFRTIGSTTIKLLMRLQIFKFYQETHSSKEYTQYKENLSNSPFYMNNPNMHKENERSVSSGHPVILSISQETFLSSGYILDSGDSTYQYVIQNASAYSKGQYTNESESNISKKQTSHSFSIANSVNCMDNHQIHDTKLVTLSHDTHSDIGNSNPLLKPRPTWKHYLITSLKRFSPETYSVFPLRLAVKVTMLPSFQAAVLLRNFAWCGLYVWGTTQIHRASSLEPWNTSQIPVVFWYVEESFMWMITWDYILELLSAQDVLGFIFSFSSLIDLATMPIAKAVARLVSQNSAVQYSIHVKNHFQKIRGPFLRYFQFGFLRVLRLARIEGILCQMIPWIGLARLRLISLIIGACVITLMFASAMFILEAPYSVAHSDYKTLNDFMFFSIVTISTVGYGDFSPHKTASKCIVMFAIVVALAFLPTQIQKLVSALQAPTTVVGRIPTLNQDYIILSGPIDPRQLISMCREFSVTLSPTLTSILIISPESVDQYLPVLRLAFLRESLSVAAIRLSHPSINLQVYYQGARAVYILGNVTSRILAKEKDLSIKDPNVLLLEDDHSTLLRFIGAQRICWPGIPVSIQLNGVLSRSVLEKMGAYSVVCLQHLKMKLIAKSCANCPGFNSLITNLFKHVPTQDNFSSNTYPRFGIPDENNSTMHLYWSGAMYGLYRLEFPKCFFGLPYTLLVRYLLKEYTIYFLGICFNYHHYWLNPVGYCIGDELRTSFTKTPFAGVVAAKSLRVVLDASKLMRIDISMENVCLEKKFLKEKKRSHRDCIEAFQKVKQENTPVHKNSNGLLRRNKTKHQVKKKKTERFSESINSKHHKSNSRNILNGYHYKELGIHLVDNVFTAKQYIFQKPELSIILVCGWPRGTATFLKTLQRSIETNVVLLAPHYPNDLSFKIMKMYSKVCVWIKGSGLEASDLLRAGVLMAKTCVVLNSSHVAWRQDLSLTETDTQSILVQKLIYALRNSKKSDRTALDDLNSVKYFSKKSNPQDIVDTTLQNFRVLFELKNTQLLGLLNKPFNFSKTQIEASFTPSVEDCLGNGNETLLWDEDTISFLYPDYVSGNATIEQMLYGIVSFDIPVSRFNIDTRIISSFVNGVSGSMKFFKNQTSSTWLEHIPSHFVSRPFGEIIEYFLQDGLKLAFAIYRCIQKRDTKWTPLQMLQGDSHQYVVITCPSLNTLLQKEDLIYILNPCPSTILGWLFCQNGT